mmetsp:Transcript_61493/g.114160  ORF Transcript_61493/g.114160 Transcript_61493/m.114160 type:complete len:961 (-) Transcript_61493:121-3003(-)
MRAAVIAVLATGLFQQAAANDPNLAIKCAGQPGFAANEYIVGENAQRKITDEGLQVTSVHGWNESTPITVIDGCPVKYYLLWGDQVHVMFTKTDPHESIALEWSQEAQVLNQVDKDIKFLFAWESHYQMAGGYKEEGGMSSHPYFHDRMIPDINGYYWGFYSNNPPLYWDAYPVSWTPSWLGFAGTYEIQADAAVDELTEQRHDFYHQGGNRKPSGFYEYQPEQHYGEENGKLRVVLSATDSNQVVSGLNQETTFFRGSFTLTNKDETGTMLVEEYTALKDFYLAACAPRRDGANAYQPWHSADDPNRWTRDKWFAEEGRDYTEIPYCTWLQYEGWNASYWDAHLTTPGGTCHFMDFVTCDGAGHIITLFLPEMGILGDATNLLATLVYLKEFNAIFNMLQGTLPATGTGFIGNNHLTSFRIWHNDMHGSIPCFGDQVYSIDVSFNRFSGELPSCAVAPNASIWWIENNLLTGTIPPNMGTFDNLRMLAVMYNQFSGQLPVELCNMHKIVEFNFEGNKLHGSVPNGCLNSGAEDKGWLAMRYLIMDHNRLSGSIPLLDRHRGLSSTCANEGVSCLLGWYQYQHNLFSGQIGNRMNDALTYAKEIDGRLLFDFKGNRLWGTLPPVVEEWAFMALADGEVGFDFTDNYFRCAPDGRWPDWAERKVGYLQHLGKCLPVAHPTSVSPSTWTVGQAGMLAVWGDDFVQRGDHSCRFIPTGSGTSRDSVATRESDNLVRCLVPVDLTVGTYQVTISNFGEDFADQSMLTILTSLPTVQIVAPVEPESADAVTAEMDLGGIDSSNFDSSAFEQAIAALLGVDPSDITILGAERRRLQSSGNLKVRFVVKTDNADLSYNQIVDALKDESAVKTQLSNRGLDVTTVNTETSAAQTQIETQTTTDNEGIPIVWIIVAAAAVVVACGLCGFIGFLYRMEKKGQAYFKESLDDDAGPSSGTTIGKTTEPNEV